MMDLLFDFHLDKAQESNMSWESLIINSDDCNFLSDILEGDTEKGIQFGEQDCELNQNAAEGFKRHVSLFLNDFVGDVLQHFA